MRKKLYWLCTFSSLTWLLAACAPQPAPAADVPPEKTPASLTQPVVQTPTPFVSALPDLGLAPELTNDTWLNVQQPLRLANLGGKVVLIDMWTFG